MHVYKGLDCAFIMKECHRKTTVRQNTYFFRFPISLLPCGFYILNYQL